MKTLAAVAAVLGIWVVLGFPSADPGLARPQGGAPSAPDAHPLALANLPARSTTPAVSAPGVPTQRSVAARDNEALTAVVQRYCQVCHNEAMLTGNLSLQDFDVARAAEQAETAERLIRKLRANMMPPTDAVKSAVSLMVVPLEPCAEL